MLSPLPTHPPLYNHSSMLSHLRANAPIDRHLHPPLLATFKLPQPIPTIRLPTDDPFSTSIHASYQPTTLSQVPTAPPTLPYRPRQSRLPSVLPCHRSIAALIPCHLKVDATTVSPTPSPATLSMRASHLSNRIARAVWASQTAYDASYPSSLLFFHRYRCRRPLLRLQTPPQPSPLFEHRPQSSCTNMNATATCSSKLLRTKPLHRSIRKAAKHRSQCTPRLGPFFFLFGLDLCLNRLLIILCLVIQI